jgi:phospholipid-binding lipoprotein MlaA
MKSQFIAKIFLVFFLFFSFGAQAKNAKETDLAQLRYYDEEEEFAEFASENSIEIYDPLEKYNRKIYAFNDAFDRYFFEHIAKGYHAALHYKIRASIRNFLTNLTLPLSATNSLLQGKLDNSLATISNFLINSTIGVAGLFDVASAKGIKYNSEDFGQTLAQYGSDSGPYLVVPFLGPSSARDFSGFVIDRSADPFGFNLLDIGDHHHSRIFTSDYRFALGSATAIDTRDRLLDTIDSIRKDSFDPYATIRSAYLQRRNAAIKN